MNSTQTCAAHDAPTISKANVLLWVAQVMLAMIFLIAGFLKAFWPRDFLAQFINWAPDVSPGLVRFIGVSEILGAIGLIVPGWTGLGPWLTALAAGGLSFVMFGASIFHLIRGEFFALPLTVFLCALAAFVEYRRLKPATL